MSQRGIAEFRATVDPHEGPAAISGMVSRLRSWMSAAGVEERAAQESLIAVGEACVNAVEHSAATSTPGCPAVEVVACLCRRLLRVEVSDTGRWLHRVANDPTYRNRGRGRMLMAALMDRVELRTGPGGTVVELTKDLSRR
jgi:anti-sigma regulatory factor (Ser/Thr protein kinase)